MRKKWVKLWTQESLYGSIVTELEPEERWVWIGLLLLAGDSIEPGKVCAAPGIPWTDEQLANILKIPLDVWLRAKEKMLRHDKVQQNDNGILHIVNWEKYQGDFEKQEYMREYMRQYRKGKRKTNSKTVNSKTINSKTPRTEEEEEEEQRKSRGRGKTERKRDKDNKSALQRRSAGLLDTIEKEFALKVPERDRGAVRANLRNLMSQYPEVANEEIIEWFNWERQHSTIDATSLLLMISRKFPDWKRRAEIASQREERTKRSHRPEPHPPEAYKEPW